MNLGADPIASGPFDIGELGLLPARQRIEQRALARIGRANQHNRAAGDDQPRCVAVRQNTHRLGSHRVE